MIEVSAEHARGQPQNVPISVALYRPASKTILTRNNWISFTFRVISKYVGLYCTLRLHLLHGKVSCMCIQMFENLQMLTFLPLGMDCLLRTGPRDVNGIEFPCLKLQLNLDALCKPAASDVHQWVGRRFGMLRPPSKQPQAEQALRTVLVLFRTLLEKDSWQNTLQNPSALKQRLMLLQF